MRVTFQPLILKHKKRKDDTYCVFIRIGFKSKYSFTETDYSVSKKDLDRKWQIKNQNILDKCNVLIKKYRDISDKIEGIESLTVKEVRQIILDESTPNGALNYSALFRQFLKDKAGSPSIAIYNATYNHLTGFAGENVLVNSITPKFLSGFQTYLSNKMGSRGVNLYLSTIRKVYNLIMDEYEYNGYEFRYPFRKYKIPKAKYPKPEAMAKEQLLIIRDIELKGVLPNRARDLFMISLLSLGTNAKDLYLLDGITDRIEYKRSKTKDIREDEAFISIKVEPEILPYIERNKGSRRVLNLSEVYSSPPKLNGGIRRGLEGMVRQINEKYGKTIIEDMDYYDARRTISSVMRNKLGISTDDISMCLNHVDVNARDLDPYVEVDWSIIDRANRKFIDWLYEDKKPTKEKTRRTKIISTQ